MDNTDEVKKCSSTTECDNPQWVCTELTELWRVFTCQNCGGTKTRFRNLYPGYQDGD